MNEVTGPKVLAIYLPQFHETPDNNRWWGKGFTDWQPVRTAESYFPQHQEPRVPLDHHYYDLSQKETMVRQAQLAQQYGIDGFCFYHYYFKNGKLELELPAENLLKWKDIHMPFCFNWASESWIRSWSRISGNVWAEKYESSEADGDRGVLVEQSYGIYDDWVKHFEYLLPFFEDDRYIKIDGKPIFIFYSPEDMKYLWEMTECWRRLAKNAGFPDLYLIGAHLNTANDCLDAAIIYEPRNSMNKVNEDGGSTINHGVRCYEYGDIWENILNTPPVFGCKTYFCAVSGYDDTPRRGRMGECLIHDSPCLFQQFLSDLLNKSIQYNNEFVFINAWNEWGEGMYLEPDETCGYGYLEAVKNAKMNMEKVHQHFVERNDNGIIKKELDQLNYNVKKFKQLFNLLDKWLFLEQEGRCDFSAFFKEKGIENIAIYGMAALGKHLLIQLRKEDLNVLFGIDRYAGQFGSDFKVYHPEEAFPETDAVVITAYDNVSISEELQSRHAFRIFSLEEIIDAMMRNES